MTITRLWIVLSAALLLGACAPKTPPPEPGTGADSSYAPAPQPVPQPAAMTLHDRVHDALQRQMGNAASDISTRVEGSTVFLSGQVGSQADHTRAHDVAHAIPGVTAVNHDSLQVSSATSLHDQVHDALQRQMGDAASGITVRVEGSTAFLSGHVGSQADHTRAHDIAHAVPGITAVNHGALEVH